MTELELQKLIRNELLARGHKCWQVDSGKKLTYKTRGHGLERGFPDLFGAKITENEIPQMFFIEVKLLKGKPSEDQIKFLKGAYDNGILNGIARSVEDAIEILEGTRTIMNELEGK
ncbi:VRR-NUC domain-containing protein [Enterococcus alishanensis]